MPTDQLTPILPPYIDATMMSCFRSCPRKFYNEFILGLRPSGLSVDLHAGGAFAHALEVVRSEVFVNQRSLSDALVRANAAFERRRIDARGHQRHPDDDGDGAVPVAECPQRLTRPGCDGSSL